MRNLTRVAMPLASHASTIARCRHTAYAVSLRLAPGFSGLALVLFCAGSVAAQASGDVARRPGASRAALEAFVLDKRQSGDAKPDARMEAVQRRLRDGDFVEGEQVVLRVAGQPALTDTFTVAPGLSLSLPGIDPVSLHGVLRSELQSHLSQHITRFVRDAQVSVRTLVRVGVIGEVRNPGFYRVPTTTPLSDVLMAAGGPTTEADLGRVSVRRGGVPSREKAPMEALALTLALDDLTVQNGDQVHVGAVKKRNWSAISQLTTVVVGTLVAVASLAR